MSGRRIPELGLRRRLIAAGLTVLLFTGGVAVRAYWAGPGSGAASAGVATLAAPGSVTGDTASIAGAVQVRWDPVTAPDGGDPTGYLVARTTGSSTVDACGSSPGEPLSGTSTSCEDPGVDSGTYTYTVTAVFRSWTATSAPSAPVVVASDPPPRVTSIVRADADPTSASSVRWTLTFSEQVNGVDGTDFALLRGGALTGPSLTSVAGSGAVYTVTAATGAGTGTLTLRLVDDDTVTDAGANRLGGTGTSGTGDGSLTGEAYGVDRSPPTVPVVTLDLAAGGTWISGTTAFVNPKESNSGSFRVTATSTDPDSGVDRLTFPSPAGTTGGGDDPTSPYEATYGWTAATTAAGAQTVTATNRAGLTATATFTITSDTTAPTTTAPTVVAGYVSTPSISVTLPPATDAGSGIAATSVVLQRDVATLTAGTCGSFTGTWTTVALVSGADTTVIHDQCYRYRQLVSDNVGNLATSAVSAAVKVDTTAPSDPVTAISAVTGSTFASGTTVFVNAQTGRAGTFTVTATATEPESTVTNITFPALSGASGGGTDATSPYSTVYAWSGAVAGLGAQTVTALNAAGLTSSSAFTVQPDTTAPTGGALSANGGAAYSSSGTIALAVTPFAETASATDSGLASSIVTRQTATLANGSCGTFSGATVVTGATDGPLSTRCYRWVLTGTDRVGNAVTVTTPAVIVDTSAPTATSVSLGSATGNSWINGTRVFINPRAGFSGAFTATATSTDANSGINRVTFPAPSGMSGGGADTTSPFATTYTWSGAVAATGAQTVTATNNAGLNATTTFTVTPDVTRPTGGALTVNGTAASGVGTSSISGTGTFSGTRTNYSETASSTASGLATSTLTRATSSVTGVSCGTFGTPVTIPSTPSASSLPEGCYLYTLTGVDRVGNTVSISTTVIVPGSG